MYVSSATGDAGGVFVRSITAAPWTRPTTTVASLPSISVFVYAVGGVFNQCPAPSAVSVSPALGALVVTSTSVNASSVSPVWS